MRQFFARRSRQLPVRAAFVLVTLGLAAGCGSDETLTAPTTNPSATAPSPPADEPLRPDAGPRIDACQIAQQFLAAEGAAEAVCGSLVMNAAAPAGALAELTAEQRCRACALVLRLATADTAECPLPVEDCPLTPNDVRACVEAAAPQVVAQLPTCDQLEQPPAAAQPGDWLRLVATTPSCATLFLKCPRAQRALVELLGRAMRSRAQP